MRKCCTTHRRAPRLPGAGGTASWPLKASLVSSAPSLPLSCCLTGPASQRRAGPSPGSSESHETSSQEPAALRSKVPLGILMRGLITRFVRIARRLTTSARSASRVSALLGAALGWRGGGDIGPHSSRAASPIHHG